MAKNKLRSSSAADAKIVPTFDEQALSALTTRIENRLTKASSSSSPQHREQRQPAPRQKQNQNGHSRNKPDTKVENSRAQNGSERGVRSGNRGVKRAADGNPKILQDSQETKLKAKQSPQHAGDEQSILLNEILALGGSKEDLDLLADAFSDDDGDSDIDALVDTSLKSDVADFIQELGITPHLDDAASDQEHVSHADLTAETSSSEGEGTLVSNAKYTAPSFAPEAAVVQPHEQRSRDDGKLIFPAIPDWHSASLPELPVPEVDEISRYMQVIRSLEVYAKSLLDNDSDTYSSKHFSATSSHKFLSTIMTSGTLSDKISALTLVVQESPVHTIKSFESLIGLAKKRSRGQAVEALGAIKDLLANGVVLPTNRRLRSFATQPGLVATLQSGTVLAWKSDDPLPGAITQAHLVSWAFEDWLKDSYFEVLQLLETWCNDEVEFARSRAVTYVYELLKEKPEQEANLLRLLVNKLGDPDKKIASRASYLLLQLQTSHPLMKGVIISSINNELLLRPGQSLHAKYYAINTLNQTILSVREEDVAEKLLDIYFALFVTLLKRSEPEREVVETALRNRKGQLQGGGAPMGKMAKAKVKAAEVNGQRSNGVEMTEKMISAVLTGVNRAFPFHKSDNSRLEEHMNTLFRITHSSNFNTSIQALMLIEQLAATKNLAVDRFYRTLYESLLDPRLTTSSKHALYLNLLYRALAIDVNIRRVKAFVKRLLQMVHLHQPPFICGVFYLLKELQRQMPGLSTLYSDPEDSLEDDGEILQDSNMVESAISSLGDAAKFSSRPLYDGRKRDPEHTSAEGSCAWESLPFLQHFHPSVLLFADRLVNNEKMPPKPDLASHSLSSFLDRFVYKNVKGGATRSRGTSIMQPVFGSDSKGSVLLSRAANTRQTPLNTEAFWRQKAEDVAVDEVFFHQYFNRITRSKRATPHSNKLDDSKKEEEGDSHDDEEEIWQALIDSRPEVEGPHDDDSDLDSLGLEELEDSIVSSESEEEIEAQESLDEDDWSSLDEQTAMSSALSADDQHELADLFSQEENGEVTSGGQTEGASKETSRQRKRRMKSLPTFASAEDYADMLEDNEDEDR